MAAVQKTVRKTKKVAQRRPAEVTTVGGALALLLSHALGWATRPETLTALGLIIGIIPATVTWLYGNAEAWGWIHPPPDLPPEFEDILPSLAAVCKATVDAAKGDAVALSDRTDALNAIAAVLTAVQFPTPSTDSGS